MQNRKNFFFHSAAFKLCSVLLLFMLPIVILLILSIFDVRTKLIQEVTSTCRSTLELYMTELDAQLQSSKSYCVNNALYESDCQIAAFNTDTAESQYARLRLKETLQYQLSSTPLIDGVFLFLPGDNPFLLNVNSNKISTSMRQQILKYIDTQTNFEAFSDSSEVQFLLNEQAWSVHSINDQTLLLYTVCAPNGIIAGAYADTEHLLSNFRPVVSSDPLRLAESSMDTPPDVPVISVSSQSGKFVLQQALSYNAIIHSLPVVHQYSALIAALLLVVPLLMVLLVRHIILKPLRALTDAMHEVERGNLAYRIPPRQTSSEIELIDKTFNSMLDEVNILKNSVYEEKLASQKAQMRNLQLQIRPHFLINTLNMVYNLMKSGKQELSATLILHAVDYFRYMVRVDDRLVPLCEEMNHVKTYMDIQQIRYQDSFSYQTQIDERVSDMLVPPMLLQCFAENAMKYAFRTCAQLRLSITVTSFEEDYIPYAQIVVRDNGDGYPADILTPLNEGVPLTHGGINHIGIYNTLTRIRFLFGEQARWRLYNDGGAVCEIILPAQFSEEEPE